MIAFSQPVTNNPKDSNNIVLSKEAAKQIAKDLVRCDSIRETSTILSANIDLLKSNLQQKDSIITYKDSIIFTQKVLIQKDEEKLVFKDEQIKQLQQAGDKLNATLKKTKAKLLVTRISTITTILGVGFLLVR